MKTTTQKVIKNKTSLNLSPREIKEILLETFNPWECHVKVTGRKNIYSDGKNKIVVFVP
jgi:hypothetical protein